MPHWQTLLPSQYMRAVDFNGRPWTGKIAEVSMESLESLDDEGDERRSKRKGAKEKGVIWFENVKQGWVLNKTNGYCLAALFGDNTDGWRSHAVTIYPAKVRFGKKEVLGIRVAGSPELQAPKQVTIQLPQRKAFTITLKPTGKVAPGQPQGASAPRPAAPPPPPADDAPPPYDGADEPEHVQSFDGP